MKKAILKFRPSESTKAGVRRIAHGLIDAGVRRARHPGWDCVEDVHFLRTTTKRLRALLQLIRPVIPAATFARENARIKRAATRLAPYRDLIVADETLRSLGEPAAALRNIGRVEGAKSEGRHRRAMQAAAHDLGPSRRSFERLRIGGEGWEAIGPGLLRVYRQARRRMKAAFADRNDPAFHRWRIRVKQLDYQLEWLEPIWPKRISRLRKHLGKLGDRLGADHDLVVLRALLDTDPEKFGDAAAIARLKECTEKRSRCLRRESRPLGAKALGRKPRRFHEACERRWSKWAKRG